LGAAGIGVLRAAALAVLSLWSLSAGRVHVDRPDGGGTEARVLRILATALAPADPVSSGDEVEEHALLQLEACGSAAIPPLVSLYVGSDPALSVRLFESAALGPNERAGPGKSPMGGLDVAGRAARLARRALRRFDRRETLDRLRRELDPSVELERRLAAAELLGDVANADAWRELVGLVDGLPSLELSYPSVRTPLRGALASCMQGGAGPDPNDLALGVLALPTASLVVDAAREAGSVSAMELLLVAVEDVSELEGAALEGIVQLVEAAPWRFDFRARLALRDRLTAEDPTLRRIAANGLARWGDARAIVDLVPAIEDSDPFVRRAALSALRTLSGTNASDVDGWWRWVEEQEDWTERRLEDVLAALASPEPAIAVRALQELAARPLLPEEGSDALSFALLHESRVVRLAACRGIARRGDPRPVPALVELLSEAVAEGDAMLEGAVRQALEALVECRENSDAWTPERWREFLAD